MSKITAAYGIPYVRCDNIDDLPAKIKEFLAIDGPAFFEAILDEHQNFEPKLSSKRLPDGTMVSPPIDDMYPFLPREEYEANKDVSKI